MLDRYTHALIQPILRPAIALLVKNKVHPDHLTWTGFLVGLLCFPLLVLHHHFYALCLILFNRLVDGLDGALARTLSPTDLGGFLDITLDFIFYPLIVLGFIFDNPTANAVSGGFLLFSFMCAATVFLSFAIMATKNALPHAQFKNKSIYYMSGLTEGTETIIFFIIACLFPSHFSLFAWTYGVLCLVTAVSRIHMGVSLLKSD